MIFFTTSSLSFFLRVSKLKLRFRGKGQDLQPLPYSVTFDFGKIYLSDFLSLVGYFFCVKYINFLFFTQNLSNVFFVLFTEKYKKLCVNYAIYFTQNASVKYISVSYFLRKVLFTNFEYNSVFKIKIIVFFNVIFCSFSRFQIQILLNFFYSNWS